MLSSSSGSPRILSAGAQANPVFDTLLPLPLSFWDTAGPVGRVSEALGQEHGKVVELLAFPVEYMSMKCLVGFLVGS